MRTQRAGNLGEAGDTLRVAVSQINFPTSCNVISEKRLNGPPRSPLEFPVERQQVQEGNAEPESRMRAKGRVSALEGPEEGAGPQA